MVDRLRAVFLDRDGVIVKPVLRQGHTLPMIPTAPYTPKEFELFPRVKDALRVLKGMNFLRILVSNQPDIALGNISVEEWKHIENEVESCGFDDVYICFHRIEDRCLCKKPNPGMILDATYKWNIDLGHSFMVGDTMVDMDAARAAGCKSIIIDTVYNQGVESDYRVGNLFEAALLIQKYENIR